MSGPAAKFPSSRRDWSQRVESESQERWKLTIIRKGERGQNRISGRPRGSSTRSRAEFGQFAALFVLFSLIVLAFLYFALPNSSVMLAVMLSGR
jgi:hypothetical protein